MLPTNDDITTIYQEHCSHLKILLQEAVIENHQDLHADEKRLICQRILNDIFDSFIVFEKTLIRWKQIKDDSHSENKILKLKLQKLKLKFNVKTHCIEKFKRNLASQYADIELYKQNNKKLEDSLDVLKKELHQSQVCQEWFKTKLHLCQREKYNVDLEFIKNKEMLEQQLLTIQTLNAKLKEVKQSTFDNKPVSVVDSVIVSDITNKITSEIDNENDQKQSSTLLITLKKMGDENLSLKQNMQELRNNFNDYIKVKSELEAKCLIYQKSVDQNKSMIDVFENLKKHLCEKLIASTENEKIKNSKILHMMTEVDLLKAEILQQRQERDKVEAMTLIINEKFIKMKSIQEILNAALKSKDELISSLNAQNKKLVDENKMYRSIEFNDKRKIQEFIETVRHLELQKQEMTAVHYEEFCNYSTKMKMMEDQINNLESELIHQNNREKLNDKNKDEMILDLKRTLSELQNRYEEKVKTLGKACVKRMDFDADVLKRLLEISRIFCPQVEIELNSSSTFQEVLDLLENVRVSILRINNDTTRIKNNNRKFRIHIYNKIKSAEEKYKRIYSISCRNMEILANIDINNVVELLSVMKDSKIMAEVKYEEAAKQQKRFEKYNRVLLRQVKEYKRLYLSTEEHNGYLQHLCNDLTVELETLKSVTSDEQNGNSLLPYENINIEEKGSTMSSSQIIITASEEDMNNDSIQCQCFQKGTSELLKTVESQTMNGTFLGNSIPDCVSLPIDFHKDCFETISAIRLRINELEHTVESKIQMTKDMTELLVEKDKRIIELREFASKNEYLMKEKMKTIAFLQSEIDLLNPRLRQFIATINELKMERSQLQNILKQREALLGKIFVAFKVKIQHAADEVHDKYFLQRLCSDLKTALKIYVYQNKVLRGQIHTTDIDIKTVTIGQQISDKHQVKYKEKYIKKLMEQQKDHSSLEESFIDIQSHIDSMKEEIIFLQAAYR